MKSKSISTLRPKRLLIQKCHHCGKIIESEIEVQKCPACQKAFLPLNYFSKVHERSKVEYDELFSRSEELNEEDLIKGIHVLW
jgi:Zn-finger nucleic acid-binding protein